MMLDKFKERNKKIFKRYNSGESVLNLSIAFNLSRTRIEDIIRQMTWYKLKKKMNKHGKEPNFLIPTIQDLNISTQTVNKLYRYGIYTIKDIEEKLPDIENNNYLSKKIVENIKNNIQVFKDSKKL